MVGACDWVVVPPWSVVPRPAEGMEELCLTSLFSGPCEMANLRSYFVVVVVVFIGKCHNKVWILQMSCRQVCS